MKSWSNAECNSAYGGGITNDMLCANGVNGAGETTDACQGDSGGPLVCDMGSGRFVLHGATSWGFGCADPQFPGVWARISHELDWIHSYVDVPAPSPSPNPAPAPSSTQQPSTSLVPSTSAAITTTTTTVPAATTSFPSDGNTCQCECLCHCPSSSSSAISGSANSRSATDVGTPGLRGGNGSEVAGNDGVAAAAGVSLAAAAVLGASVSIGFVVGRRAGSVAGRKDTE